MKTYSKVAAKFCAFISLLTVVSIESRGQTLPSTDEKVSCFVNSRGLNGDKLTLIAGVLNERPESMVLFNINGSPFLPTPWAVEIVDQSETLVARVGLTNAFYSGSRTSITIKTWTSLAANSVGGCVLRIGKPDIQVIDRMRFYIAKKLFVRAVLSEASRMQPQNITLKNADGRDQLGRFWKSFDEASAFVRSDRLEVSDAVAKLWKE